MSDLDLIRRLRYLEEAVERLQAAGVVRQQTGSWAPTLVGTTTPGTLTYTIQTGLYARLGTVVVVHGYMLINTVIVAPVGEMLVGSFPLLSRNSANGFQSLAISQYNLINLSAGCLDLGLRLTPNATHAALVENYDNAVATAVQGSAIGAGTVLFFGGSYLCKP